MGKTYVSPRQPKDVFEPQNVYEPYLCYCNSKRKIIIKSRSQFITRKKIYYMTYPLKSILTLSALSFLRNDGLSYPFACLASCKWFIIHTFFLCFAKSRGDSPYQEYERFKNCFVFFRQVKSKQSNLTFKTRRTQTFKQIKYATLFQGAICFCHGITFLQSFFTLISFTR